MRLSGEKFLRKGYSDPSFRETRIYPFRSEAPQQSLYNGKRGAVLEWEGENTAGIRQPTFCHGSGQQLQKTLNLASVMLHIVQQK